MTVFFCVFECGQYQFAVFQMYCLFHHCLGPLVGPLSSFAPKLAESLSSVLTMADPTTLDTFLSDLILKKKGQEGRRGRTNLYLNKRLIVEKMSSTEN